MTSEEIRELMGRIRSIIRKNGDIEQEFFVQPEYEKFIQSANACLPNNNLALLYSTAGFSSRQLIVTRIGTPVNSNLGSYEVCGNFIGTTNEMADYSNNLAAIIVMHIIRNDSFRRANPNDPCRPLNIAIVAPPGSGKSFFIKQLWKEVNNLYMQASPGAMTLEYLEVLANNIHSYTDLTTLLISPASVLNSPQKALFIDEIDSTFAGDRLYQRLLQPMEDGRITSGNGTPGKDLITDVLFFAASEVWDPGEDLQKLYPPNRFSFRDWSKDKITRITRSKHDDVHKLNDFISRIDQWITLPPISLRFNGATDYVKRVDAIVMSLAKKIHPNLSKIEIAVVWLLREMLVHDVPLREVASILRRIVFLKGTITSKDVSRTFSDYRDELSILQQVVSTRSMSDPYSPGGNNPMPGDAQFSL